MKGFLNDEIAPAEYEWLNANWLRLVPGGLTITIVTRVKNERLLVRFVFYYGE